MIEANATNAKYLLNLLTCFVMNESKSNPSVLFLVTQVMGELMIHSSQWPQDVIFAAMDSINLMAEIWAESSPERRSTPKPILIQLCSYIDLLFQNESIVSVQAKIVKAYDLLLKWALTGDWIISDYESQKILISIISRGVAILDREKEFSNVTSITQDSPWPNRIVSSNSIPATTASSKDSGLLTVSNMLNLVGGHHQSSSSSSSGKKDKRISAAPKLFNKIPIRMGGGNTVQNISTGSKDGGLGLPTFAVLSAEIQIKSVADAALSCFCNHLSNFPSKGSQAGVSKIGTNWDEFKEYEKLQHDTGEGPVQKPNRIVRYFGYDNRIIIGIMERPEGHEQDEPRIAMSLRDGTGRYSWYNQFLYKNTEFLEDKHLNQSQADLGQTKVLDKLAEDPLTPQVSDPPRMTKLFNYKSINEENISTLDSLIKETEQKLVEINHQVKAQIEMETQSNISVLDKSEQATPISVHFPKLNIPQNFRIFLTHLGLLDLKQQHKLRPLMLNEDLIKDLQKLDRLAEYLLLI